MEKSRSVYLEYLSKHIAHRQAMNNLFMYATQQWLDRQYTSDKRISEYIAVFFILRYGDKYLGVVESTRPNSATYLYNFPNKNVLLYSSFYRNDFAEPYILREPDRTYMDRKQYIKQLFQVKLFIQTADRENCDLTQQEKRFCFQVLLKSKSDRLDEALSALDFGDLCSLEDIVKDIIEETYQIINTTPIKHRSYYIGEIAHSDLETWSIKLENMITDFLEKEKNIEKKQPENIREGNNQKSDFFQNDLAMELFGYFGENYFYSGCPDTSAIEKEMQENYGIKETLKEIPNKKGIRSKKSNVKEQVKKNVFDPSLLFDKSIKQIAFMFHISPVRLLSIIQNRIGIHVNSIDDILDQNKVNLCGRIFEELWYINNKGCM